MVQTTEQDGITFRELEKTRQIIEKATGLEITWAYDDLVFVEHSAFLIRFDNGDSNKIHCYFNVECLQIESDAIFKELRTAADEKHITILNSGTFRFDQQEGTEELQIHFNEFV